MSGLKLSDPALAQAIGSEGKLTVRGSASPAGEATFDTLELAAPGFDARYSGTVARRAMRGRLEVTTRT